jgi:predicted dienelactone hydrolase
VALHSGNEVHRVLDLSLVIDVLLARNMTESDLLFDGINPKKIGVSGFSAGGSAAIGVVSGWAAQDIAPDRRIKAMVLYEPGSNYRLDDARGIEIPYLIMGGSQNRNGVAIPTLFEATVDATPRIYVLNPNATHFNYLTGMGSEIQQTREAA